MHKMLNTYSFFNCREPTPVHGRDPLHHLHLGHSLGQTTTGSCLSQPPDSPASSRSAARSPPNLEFTDEQLEADLHHLPSDTNSCDLNRKFVSIRENSKPLKILDKNNYSCLYWINF